MSVRLCEGEEKRIIKKGNKINNYYLLKYEFMSHFVIQQTRNIKGC
jgi:hypothetical protein